VHAGVEVKGSEAPPVLMPRTCLPR
jgi:hypothetical protein